ncbi:hypothetical protein PG995_011744 [Apiospora arundinis]
MRVSISSSASLTGGGPVGQEVQGRNLGPVDVGLVLDLGDEGLEVGLIIKIVGGNGGMADQVGGARRSAALGHIRGGYRVLRLEIGGHTSEMVKGVEIVVGVQGSGRREGSERQGLEQKPKAGRLAGRHGLRDRVKLRQDTHRGESESENESCR